MIVWKRCQINIWSLVKNVNKPLRAHNVNMPKRQTSFNSKWTKEHEFISKSSRDAFRGFCTLWSIFMYFYYFQKSTNVMVFGTVPDYLFIYVFLLFPEVQKCYVFRHCALCKTGSSQWSVFETDITMSWINTNTVNKHFFAYSFTYRSTSRYIIDQIVWQWIE